MHSMQGQNKDKVNKTVHYSFIDFILILWYRVGCYLATIHASISQVNMTQRLAAEFPQPAKHDGFVFAVNCLVVALMLIAKPDTT